MGSRDKRIDEYIARQASFARPILRHIRAVVHTASPAIDEDIKWGFPWFTYRGKPLAYMAGFKAHVGFGFYRGKLVMGEGREKQDAMGSFGRLTGVRDLPGKAVIVRFVKKAVALAGQARASGKAPVRAAKPMPRVPPALAKALAADATLRAQWNAFTPGKRREYLEWISSAKQDSTRDRRLATTVAQVREGKSQNWRYEAKVRVPRR
ncbi:MAG TPA: YdeI/OmpD-associated family protein [Gemmatimonadaceae bacterium]|jgi:uncharacterized protein YdeI (YjbR/CyaY-like superfamily)